MLSATTIALVAAILSSSVDPGAVPSGRLAGDRPGALIATQGGKPEPPSAEVRMGDKAPDFSFEGFDGRWRRLRDLRLQGPVLLVFAPDEQELRTIARERERLLSLGVLPVAIVDASSRTAFGLVKKLGLRYSVLADPRRVIAEQFNSTEWRTNAAEPAWFVIDQKGYVRALDRGTFPSTDYTTLAARALGKPIPGNVVPTSR
jgi:peroxiredoxin